MSNGGVEFHLFQDFQTINVKGQYLFFHKTNNVRGGDRAAATSKIERFVIIVNGWKPLTIITKHSILDVAAVLDPPLELEIKVQSWMKYCQNIKIAKVKQNNFFYGVFYS